MKTKQLWQFNLTVNRETEDAATELLIRRFKRTVTSYEDFKTHRCRLSIVLEAGKNFERDRIAILAGLKQIRDCGLVTGRTSISLRRIKPKDWSESWKSHFRPIEIGHRLLIKASWHRCPAKNDQAVVVLDPGLSFGTGQHATTSFCLSEIVRFSPQKPPSAVPSSSLSRKKTAKTPATSVSSQNPSLLDIGTGSGILAIAAAKLGYAPVHAFDFDPQAVTVARKNARNNAVDKKVSVRRGDVSRLPARRARQYSVVCANLLSNLLVEERYRILHSVEPKGVVVLAGILAGEFGLVRRAYEDAGCKLLRSRREKEWRSGSFQRPPALRKSSLSSRRLGAGPGRKHWAG